MQLMTLLKPHGGVNPTAKFRFRLLTHHKHIYIAGLKI